VPYWSSWSKWSISCLSDEGLCISDNVTQDAIILGYVLFGSQMLLGVRSIGPFGRGKEAPI
jgi:hypothetical protein